jgi:hypothetical protein
VLYIIPGVARAYTEYMAGGSLRHLLDTSRSTITEAKRRKIAKDVAMGVNYLHHHKPKIIHRYEPCPSSGRVRCVARSLTGAPSSSRPGI